MFAATLLAAAEVVLSQPPSTVGVSASSEGRLVYTAGARGDTVVDFSYAGYGGGGRAIPDVPAVIVVQPVEGDDGARIQAAIEIAAARPPGADGFRGAVLLEAGRYDIDASLRIGASGVVLRGSGAGPDGTELVATGTSRRALIDLSGEGSAIEVPGSRRAISDDAAVGSRQVVVADAIGYRIGDRVIVTRPSSIEWIASLGMNTFQGWRPEDRLHWKPGSRDIAWDRTVTAVDGRRLTLDAPLTTALSADTGGGWLARYEFPGRIRQVGVEHLRLVSAFDASRPADEDHAWTAIAVDKIEDAWVRQVTALHFVDSAVDVQAGARSITVEDVDALDPIAENGGYRRRMFSTSGELTLFQRCRSRGGRHDFVTGFAAAGPNVFLDSTASDSLGFTGPLESWASGVLYDNVRVRGGAIRLGNLGIDNQGAGWAAANSVLWNCEATDVAVWNPPGGYNLAYGCRGTASGDGIVEDARAAPFRDFFRAIPVRPRSLYLAQLDERVGSGTANRLQWRSIATAPARVPRLTTEDVSAFVRRTRPGAASRTPAPLDVKDGHFTIGAARGWTTRVSYSWYQAQMAPSRAPAFGPAITRFAPGRTGPGLTDDLEQVVASMPRGAVFYQHYGLWYDRRRVNHNYDGSAERRTGDVWAPFMELPWARSGTGKAWDGLSRYDLTRFNPWYFQRLATFAGLCDRDGRILYYNFYFQHWLLESRAHYVDFPWRPVNALQDTGLPDEVPAANAFWDLSHPVRRDLHRRYIRKVLDTLGRNTNVAFGIDREYTGSLAFLRFWLDEIAAWQRDRGRRLKIVLEVPKDQMDAILEDPARGPLVSAVDFHGWVYRPDGKLFAIRGGLNRSPREQRQDIATAEERDTLRRRLDPALAASADYENGPEFQKLFDDLWASTKLMKNRAVQEYRSRYPGLVILAGEPAP